MLKEAAQKTYFDILKSRGEKLLRYPPLVAADLSPPTAVRDGVSVLLEIIETHNSTMVPVSRETPDFNLVISALLDPIIQVCLCFVLILSVALYLVSNYFWPIDNGKFWNNNVLCCNQVFVIEMRCFLPRELGRRMKRFHYKPSNCNIYLGNEN